jgi:drug/metabolite transporter (DMT)-like permease
MRHAPSGVWFVVGVLILTLGSVLTRPEGAPPATGFLLVAVALLLYFVPTAVARHRHHPQVRAIFWLNLLAGWTFVGWVVAFVWAMIDYRRAP